jgi:hypothetical protein
MKTLLFLRKLEFSLIIFIITVILTNCVPPDPPPNLSLKIGFVDTNFIFNKYPRDSIKFNYYVDSFMFFIDDKGIRQYQNYVIIGRNYDCSLILHYPYYRISLGTIPFESAYHKVKYFYLAWPNGDIDTIYADYYIDDYGDNNCSCTEPLKELKFNEKKYIKKTDYDVNGVFVF